MTRYSSKVPAFARALRAILATLGLVSCMSCFGGWQVPAGTQGTPPINSSTDPTPGDSPNPTTSESPAPTDTPAPTLSPTPTPTAPDANTMATPTPTPTNGNMTADPNCQPIAAFFDAQMWTPVMSGTCVTCHQDAGNPFHLTPGDPNASLIATEAEAKKTGTNNMSLLLLKPTGQTTHGGGMIFNTTSSTYTAFQAFVTAVQGNASCVTSP